MEMELAYDTIKDVLEVELLLFIYSSKYRICSLLSVMKVNRTFFSKAPRGHCKLKSITRHYWWCRTITFLVV